MKSKFPFIVTPKYWWFYLYPSFWKQKKILEEFFKYQWEHGGREEIEKRIKNSLLYGTSHPEMWKDGNDDPTD